MSLNLLQQVLQQGCKTHNHTQLGYDSHDADGGNINCKETQTPLVILKKKKEVWVCVVA